MSESCNHDCSNCSSNCADRSPESFRIEPNKYSRIKKVIGVVSGKGGVGKSFVTSLLASGLQKKGYSCGILDADITGPSIPKMFGIKEKAGGNQYGMLPVLSKNGTQVMSINVLVDNETDPVVWRGPVIAGVVQQFWQEVIWHDVDCLFVDMPPGTGDVSLTVFQSIPVDGIIIVTSPQDLVSMIVGKAVNMAKMMNVPILGIVENMSYVECDSCGHKIMLYGESKLEKVAQEYQIAPLAQLPIRPENAAACDKGEVEDISMPELEQAYELIEYLMNR